MDVRKTAGELFWGQAGLPALDREKLARKLLDEDFLADLVQRFDKNKRNAMYLFGWWTGSQGLPRDRAEYLLAEAGDPRAAASLDSLMAKGLLFLDFGGRDVLVMPEDLAGSLSSVLARNYLPRPVSETVPGPAFTGGFYEDCLTLLAYAHKNRVEITQKGLIHKRTLDKILDLLQVKERTADLPAALPYPFRFLLLLNYCISVRLLSFQDRELKVNLQAVRNWLEEEPLARIYHTVPFVWDFCSSEYPHGRVGAMLELMEHMKENCWYSHADLVAAARVMTGPFTNSLEPDLLKFLQILLDTGLLVEGRSRKDERLVRLGFWSSGGPLPEVPALPVEEDGVWVQPNFEVIAPPHLAPDVRWQLAMLADPVKVDQAFTYALTREAAYTFFDCGGGVEELIDFLERHSKAPCPQNILFTIREWGALYGRLSFCDVLLLKCDDVLLADEIAGHPKLKAYVQGRFDPNHLIVSRSKFDSFRKALRKEGYFPRKEIALLST